VARRALPHNLLVFVDLEAGQLQVRDHPLCELLTRSVGDVLFQHPPQQVALLADRKADREKQQVAERVPGP
jgi:hypothetical protein